MKAFELGYNAAINNGQCIFAHNKDAMTLLNGNKVGDKDNMLIMNEFRDGVDSGIQELTYALMGE